MRRPVLFYVFYLLLNISGAWAQVFDAVIAADGSGNYTSIQDAVDRQRSNSSGRFLFYVKPGNYTEKISIFKDNVSLVGAGADEVIVSWDDYSGDSEGHTTSSSYTFQVSGDYFYAENITFENTAGDVGQAVAVSTTGSQQIFKSCRFLGFQDTYYARQGMQYLVNCYIEGATDFIFGEATTVMDNCQIHCLNGGQYITAPADTKLITQVDGGDFYHGLLFLNSQITAAGGVGNNSYYLGRPWQPNASSVYISCTLGDHIRPEGWSDWDNDNHLTGFFGEYNSMDPEGNPVDVSGRVSWSTQLTTNQAENYYNLDYFLNGWDPLSVTSSLEKPTGVTQDTENMQEFKLTWSAVTGALGYAILKNEQVFAFSGSTSFTDTIAVNGDSYQVAAINSFGGIGMLSESVTVAGLIVLSVEGEFGFRYYNGIIEATERIDLEVYSLQGILLKRKLNAERMSLDYLKQGLYLIRIQKQSGEVMIRKIAL